MQFRSISLRVFFWMLVISMLPLVAMSEVFIREFEKQVYQSEFSYLERMSDKKYDQINDYFDERIADIEILAKSPLVCYTRL